MACKQHKPVICVWPPILTWIWIIIAWRNEDKQGKLFSLCYNDWEMRCLSLDHHDMGNLFWGMPGSITELCTNMLTRGIEVMFGRLSTVWVKNRPAFLGSVHFWYIVKQAEQSKLWKSNNLGYPLHDPWMPRPRTSFDCLLLPSTENAGAWRPRVGFHGE
jgi:hypothetical protein